MGNDTKKLFRNLALANFALAFGFNVWQAVFNNFAVDELAVDGLAIGSLQSIREIPGLLGFLLGFLAIFFSERRIIGLSLLMMGGGIILTGTSNIYAFLVFSTLVMSTGFHFFGPSNSSLVLMAHDKKEAPKVLGRLVSVQSFASVIGTIMIWLFVEGSDLGPIHLKAWGYRTTLIVAGVVVMLISLFMLYHGRGEKAEKIKRKVIFRRRYWLYYLLTFLMGSRRHIFSTFAIFLLVQVHGIDVRTTAALYLANSLVSTYTTAQLGKIVSRFGERKVLTFNFIGLIFVFLGYAYIPNLAVLFGLFVLDNVFFGFNLAIESYFQKIAVSPEEITSNVSMAVTINHISALIVPVLGGLLWEKVSPSATFLAGVGIAIVSLVFVQFIRTNQEEDEVLLPQTAE